MYKLIKKSKISNARLGVLNTAHGKIRTPFFMPVATQGAVKRVSTAEMRKLGAQMLLANTYHLMLKPGESIVKKAGGLHKFMNWDKPILTDSGGFQVFSLSGAKKKSGESLVKLARNGVKFKSYIDGREYYLTPEKALRIQSDLGVDIAVCLDQCAALPASRDQLAKAVELTSYWAEKTKTCHMRDVNKFAATLLFAVIQGGLDKELRLKSLCDLISIGFDGYNIGGLSVGETPAEMLKVLDYLVSKMPADKPRYLMGVGYPENIAAAVKRGVDMFDCVIPTREGRHGRLFRSKNLEVRIKNNNFYETININNANYARDFRAINNHSKLPELRKYSLAYLHYLFKINEPLGQRLASLNNIEFYLDLMADIRYSIRSGTL